VGDSGKKPKPELRPSEARTPQGTFQKGVSGNPGGQSKEKRAFLERLKSDDAEEVYEAFMDGVRAREWPVVIRAAEYLAGRPAAAKEDNEALRESGAGPLLQRVQALASREDVVAFLKGDESK